MKRLYIENKWKLHSAVVSKKVIKKKKKNKQLIFINLKQLRESEFITITKNQALLRAPEKFSIIENAETMLSYFKAIDDCVKKNFKSVYLNLSEVNYLTHEAILYILSRIYYYNHVNKNVRISGNKPRDEACKTILEQSGFFKFVYSGRSIFNIDKNVYTIESYTHVEPEIAKEVKDFAVDKIKLGHLKNLKPLYATLIECMGNTLDHAYKSTKRSVTHKWWLMAVNDEHKNEVNYIFLDNGSGIPETIRKNYKEHILRFLPIFRDIDSQLILSCLNGEFRTETKAKHRGKGLPSIYKYCKDNVLKNLKIISRKGYVDCGQGKVHELQNNFFGTLLTWTIS